MEIFSVQLYRNFLFCTVTMKLVTLISSCLCRWRLYVHHHSVIQQYIILTYDYVTPRQHNPNFSTDSAEARHWTGSLTGYIQLTLSRNLPIIRLNSLHPHPSRTPSGSFKRRFRVKILYVFFLCPIPAIHSNHNVSSILQILIIHNLIRRE